MDNTELSELGTLALGRELYLSLQRSVDNRDEGLVGWVDYGGHS